MRIPSRLFNLQDIVEMTKASVRIHNMMVRIRKIGSLWEEEGDVEWHCNVVEEVCKVECVEAEYRSIEQQEVDDAVRAEIVQTLLRGTTTSCGRRGSQV